jgi:type IX secretion system PorP/SprF family membrane protein
MMITKCFRNYLKKGGLVLMLSIASVLSFGLIVDANAQQPLIFNESMFNTMLINPAYTGTREVFTVSALGRRQWVGINGAPTSESISANSPLRRSKSSMGFNLMNEHFGVTSRTGLYYNYAYRIKVGNGRGGIRNKGRGPGIGKLSFGMSGGFDLRFSDWTNVVTGDPINSDPEFYYDSGTKFEPNFGAGAYFNNDKYYIGLSIPRFLLWSDNPKEQSNELSVRLGDIAYYLIAGAVYDLSREVKVRPSVLFKWLPNSSFQADFNTNLIFKERYTIGATYRTSSSFAVLAQIYITRQFSFGYSYDYSFSELRGFSSGSHEILLQYEFGFNIKSSNPRYF